jgi:DtxR family transcriptional regulator, Mn-dependent transcriptional regulator
MLPSFTVENYLKAIFQAQTALARPDGLVPMGQLAAALNVVPGTATTMVKTLAESGLVRYEPYAGVRLTKAGEKLAALVLRRHRLIELFLVKVMGMSWTEVHDEAEALEHAVSDRLIDRIDEMLGRPEVDPHGDPIPNAEGTLQLPAYETLLTCPLNAPMRVSRVSDQDREFLEFVERHDLKPGALVQVAERDPAADSVRVKGSREITIGARAASKVLVRAVGILLMLLSLAATAVAQQGSAASPTVEPFKISDNSFLVEEAFNQEAGIFQNIFNAARSNGDWAATFTQEWPVVIQAHQFSYTLAWGSAGGDAVFGDTMLNYRYQAMLEGPGRPAFSPRISLILPTASEGAGDESAGLQFNLPFSKQTGDVYWHWNAGLTWLPSANLGDETRSLESPFVSGSAIVRLQPMLHAMLETVVNFDEQPASLGTVREKLFTISPGVRGGWNLGDQQLIVGVAVPFTWSDVNDRDTAAFFYVSYELPFRKQ